MSDKPIAPCRHCGNGRMLLIHSGVDKWVECDICGSRGPRSAFHEHAINDWNVLCSAIPRAQIEALEAEMRAKAQRNKERALRIAKTATSVRDDIAVLEWETLAAQIIEDADDLRTLISKATNGRGKK